MNTDFLAQSITKFIIDYTRIVHFNIFYLIATFKGKNMTFVSFPSVFVNQFWLDTYFLSVVHCFFASLLIVCVVDCKKTIDYTKNRYIIAFFGIMRMKCSRLQSIAKFTIDYAKNRYIIAFLQGVQSSSRYFSPFRYFLLF